MSQQNFNINISVLPIENSIDLPIGTKFTIGKIQYEVVRANNGRFADTCEGCMMALAHCPIFRCNGLGRQDHQEVFFTITNLEDQL